MLALVLKLALAPALVAVATWMARRVGPRAGGLVGGLPVVAGPIVLVYAVEHGDRFARTAAAAAVLGIISLVGFCVAYAAVALRASVAAALAAGSLAFALGTVALCGVDPPLAVSATLTLAAIAAGVAIVDAMAAPQAAPGPRRDLLIWRLVITAALVVGLTAAAGGLSAHLAGLLVPLPIITAVLACFTQASAGAPAAVELLGGLVRALVSFLAFFSVLAALLAPAGAPAAFALATLAALACWAVLVRR